MKPIRSLSGPTVGLKKYLANDGDMADWPRFYSYDGSIAYGELRDALVSLQHGLCGYCEISLLVGLDCQIEHVIPRSDPAQGAANTFNEVNLIACCEGGTKENLFGPESRSSDTDRFQKPSLTNTSCGQKKKDGTILDFIDPKKLPDFPPLFRVGLNGEITVDESACVRSGVSAESAGNTIAFLGLNVPRLQRARQNYLSGLDDDSDGHLDIPEAVIDEARKTLLPDDAGILCKFFTTSRSYFGNLGEHILSGSPQSWI